MIQVLDLWSAPLLQQTSAAPCYVAWLGSAIHGAFAFVDSNHATPALCWQHTETIDDRSLQEGPGGYSQVLPHRIALGPL